MGHSETYSTALHRGTMGSRSSPSVLAWDQAHSEADKSISRPKSSVVSSQPYEGRTLMMPVEWWNENRYGIPGRAS